MLLSVKKYARENPDDQIAVVGEAAEAMHIKKLSGRLVPIAQVDIAIITNNAERAIDKASRMFPGYKIDKWEGERILNLKAAGRKPKVVVYINSFDIDNAIDSIDGIPVIGLYEAQQIAAEGLEGVERASVTRPSLLRAIDRFEILEKYEDETPSAASLPVVPSPDREAMDLGEPLSPTRRSRSLVRRPSRVSGSRVKSTDRPARLTSLARRKSRSPSPVVLPLDDELDLNPVEDFELEEVSDFDEYGSDLEFLPEV